MTERTLEVGSVIKTLGFSNLLTDVYFKCKTSEIIGILGRNGSGKSTLLKIIFGTVSADNKIIRFDDVIYEKPFEKGNLVSYLPQNQFLPKNKSLKKITEIYFSEKEVRQKILTHQRVKPHVNKKVTELSGGERRFFEVLLILNLPVPFVLLDEPFSSVEPIYRLEIKDTIENYKKKKGIILTDHDHANLIDVSDRIFLIDRGVCRYITQREQLIEYNYLPPERPSEKEQEISSFTVDQQTLKDLGLDNLEGPDSFFSIFGKPATKGGKAELERLIHDPSQNLAILKQRQETIKFFQEHEALLNINKKQLDFISFYLDSGVKISSASKLDSLFAVVQNKWKDSNDFYIKRTGIQFTFEFLKDLNRLSTEIQKIKSYPFLSSIAYEIQGIIHEKSLLEFINNYEDKPFFLLSNTYDHLLRKKNRQHLIKLLEIIYQLEAFQTISRASAKLKFRFPDFISDTIPEIELKGLYHPKIQNAIANDIYLSDKANICFLTGANMAGKSSFLKAFGIAVYLAHLGFPVPATRMKISLFDGLVSTINLSDNLYLGLSHFYSEVIRVKEVAKQLSNGKKLVVIFDELFRGTNVKDAHRATYLIIKALTRAEGSAFLISSHILEVAEELKDSKNVFFEYFNTELIDNEPQYTFKLKKGVAAESFGINIVLREGILELLEGKIPPSG